MSGAQITAIAVISKAENAVSFVTTSLSMRLHLPFTRRRLRQLPKPGRFENTDKSRRFKTIRFHLSCKRGNRINLNMVTILAQNFTWAKDSKW